MRWQICLLALLTLAPACYAGENQWVLKRDADDVRIYQQPTASGYPLTRGETVITVAPGVLIAAISDRKNCSRWVYACRQGELVKYYSETQRLDYTVIDSPLWYADRDVYIRSDASLNRQAKTVTIRLSGQENYDKEFPGRVRIRDVYGLWHLRRITPDTTGLTYQIHSNPQLPPSALLSAYIAESTFQTLKKLRQIAHDPAYKKTAIPIPW